MADSDPSGHSDGDSEPLTAWLAEGFSEAEADLWRRWQFPMQEARSWKAVGVHDAVMATRWRIVGVTPETVSQWTSIGVDAEEALQWNQFGFDLPTARAYKAAGHNPTEAYESIGSGGDTVVPMTEPLPRRSLPGGELGRKLRRFMEAGIPGELLHGYMVRRWFNDEALEWAKERIEADAARFWKELGFLPHEARRVSRNGVGSVEVILQWWRAGIPLEEVAGWLRAEFSAEEAAAYRAKGVNAKQAAALRADQDEAD